MGEIGKIARTCDEGSGMKVLFVTTCPCFYRVRFFEELGSFCDLTVVYEDGTERYRKDNGKYYQLDAKGKYRIAELKSMHIRRYNFAIGLFRLIRKECFDVVVFGIVESFSCMLSMQKMHDRHMPYILNIDGLDEKKRNFAKTFACRHFISMAPMLLSPSASNDHVLRLYGARPEHIRRYPFASYGEDQMLKEGLNKEERLQIRKRLGLPSGNLAVSVCQLIPRKNPLALLKIWKEVSHPDDHLLIIGRGELEAQVRKQAGGNVSLVGFVPSDKIPLYYRAADFSILFSHEDAWGLVISESLANATPVVATDACYAATELLRNDYDGQLIRDDEKELASALGKMLKMDEEVREGMSRNCINVSRPFSVESMVRIHMGIFDEFVKLQ